MLLVSFGAQALPIQFEYTGTGTGSIGATSFTDADFRFVATGDTDNRQFGPGRWIPHDSVSVWIDGLGTTRLTSPTASWVNGTIIGFSRANSPTTLGYDLFQMRNLTGVSGWDMLSSIGPFTGTGGVMQWTGPAIYTPVNTDLGRLVFTTDRAIAGASYQATVGAVPAVPNRAPLVLLGLGMLVLTGIVRRR